MAIKFKKKCIKCKTNYVMASNRTKWVVCYECQKKQMDQPIDDPAMKEMFDLPEELYKANSFLRDIKIKYIQYGELSEKQIEAFKKTSKEMLEASRKKDSEGSKQSEASTDSKEE